MRSYIAAEAAVEATRWKICLQETAERNKKGQDHIYLAVYVRS